MTAPHELSVADAVARLDVRELTAEALVRDCLARIADREPLVEAWQVIASDAIEQARRIDARSQRPLLRGLPVGIKDLIDTEDLPTTYGSAIYAAHRPTADAACVAALRTAGAVIVGKTVTTEFAAYTGGKTRNPHDPARTPGGSSSGSAAGVADRMVPAALGSQTAGSVIRPASFCGAVGYKPTFGTFDLRGVHPLAPSLDTLGFFVREVADVPWIAAALDGSGPPDRISEPPKQARLGLCRTDQWPRAEPSTHRLIEDAARELERGGARLSDVDAFAGVAAAQAVIMAAEAAEVFRAERKSHDAQFSATFRIFLDEGERTSSEQIREARHVADGGRRELDEVFRRFDYLVTPAAVGEAPIGLQSTGDPAFCRAWTLLGCPCISLPVLKGPAGLPVGLQLVGAPGQDARLLAIASWVEKQFAAS
ncbi:MAG TPA: amidase [Myxococcales bacterium]|nr:amidase [Myxococcales bacterium]